MEEESINYLEGLFDLKKKKVGYHFKASNGTVVRGHEESGQRFH